MEEIKQVKMETKPVEAKEVSLVEKVDLLMDAVQSGKVKKLKLMRKARASARNIRKGYIGVLKVEENGNISGELQKAEDFSFKLKSGTYHASDGSEVLMWEGKYPIIIQPTWKINPVLIRNDKEKNETYGQKYVMAKMLKDTIVAKKGGFGNIIIWLLVIGAVIFGITKFF